MYYMCFLSLYYAFLHAYMGRTLKQDYPFGKFTDWFVYIMMSAPLSGLNPLMWLYYTLAFAFMFAPSPRMYIPFSKSKDWFPTREMSFTQQAIVYLTLASRYTWGSILLTGSPLLSLLIGLSMANGYFISFLIGGNDKEGKIISGALLGLLIASV